MLRASNAGRWVPCPASPRLEQPFPDVPSPDAQEGDAAHWAAMWVLGGYAGLDEITDRPAPNGIIVDEEMAEHVQTYTDVVRQVTATPVVERTIPPPVAGIERVTPDAVYVADGHGFVWDLKYGYSIVEARNNWQLATYALALFAKHEWALDAVTATIVQPRPYHPDGRVRSWTITYNEALTLHQHLAASAQRTGDPDAPTVTGPHCKYCRALHVCEAARRAGLNAVDMSTAATPVDLPPDALSAEIHTLRRAQDAIKLRLDALESHATSLIDGGKVLPGWSLERSWGRTRWQDDAKVAALEALSGVALMEQKPVSPAQAKKRGVDESLVKMFSTTPETGRKLVARDSSAKAAEVFK